MEPPLPPLRSGKKMPENGGSEALPASRRRPPARCRRRAAPVLRARACWAARCAGPSRPAAGRAWATPGLAWCAAGPCAYDGPGRPAANRKPRRGLIRKNNFFCIRNFQEIVPTSKFHIQRNIAPKFMKPIFLNSTAHLESNHGHKVPFMLTELV